VEALEIFIRSYTQSISNSDQLLELAYRRAALDALQWVKTSWQTGETSTQVLTEALEFAESVATDGTELLEVAAVKQRLTEEARPRGLQRMLYRLIARVRQSWEFRVRDANLGYGGLPIKYSDTILLNHESIRRTETGRGDRAWLRPAAEKVERASASQGCSES
jgi:hypothetical protein